MIDITLLCSFAVSRPIFIGRMHGQVLVLLNSLSCTFAILLYSETDITRIYCYRHLVKEIMVYDRQFPEERQH